MTGKTTVWALVSVVLAWQSAVFAHEAPPHACHDASHHCERGLSCARIWAWLTYRPLPVPKELRHGPVFVQTAAPPYYAYFLYMYGPRSPALGFPPRPAHHGDHCEHGMPAGVYPNPPGLDIASPEEGLPIPDRRPIPPSPSLPDAQLLFEPGPIREQEPTEPATLSLRQLKTGRGGTIAAIV